MLLNDTLNNLSLTSFCSGEKLSLNMLYIKGGHFRGHLSHVKKIFEKNFRV